MFRPHYWMFRGKRWSGRYRKGGSHRSRLTLLDAGEPELDEPPVETITLQELPPLKFWKNVRTIDDCRKVFQLIETQVNERLATIRSNL